MRAYEVTLREPGGRVRTVAALAPSGLRALLNVTREIAPAMPFRASARGVAGSQFARNPAP